MRSVRGSVPANGLPVIDTVEVVADVAMTTGVAGLAFAQPLVDGADDLRVAHCDDIARNVSDCARA